MQKPYIAPLTPAEQAATPAKVKQPWEAGGLTRSDMMKLSMMGGMGPLMARLSNADHNMNKPYEFKPESGGRTPFGIGMRKSGREKIGKERLAAWKAMSPEDRVKSGKAYADGVKARNPNAWNEFNNFTGDPVPYAKRLLAGESMSDVFSGRDKRPT